jgi:hypothetical protein
MKRTLRFSSEFSCIFVWFGEKGIRAAGLVVYACQVAEFNQQRSRNRLSGEVVATL